MAQGRDDPLGAARAAGGLLTDALLDRLARARDSAGAAAREDDGATATAVPAPRPVAPAEHRPSFVEARIDDAADLVGAAASRALPAILDRIDVNSVLDRIDVARVVDRIDVARVVDRVDVEGLVDRIDVERLLARIDLDALVDRIDVERLTRRIDVGELAADALDAIDVGDVIRESTASLGTETVEGFRLQAILADGLVARAVDRLLGRAGPRGGSA